MADYELPKLSDRHLRFMLANCSNEPVPRSLTVGETDYYVQHYIFPVQFILGVAGNCINLIVLLSSGMKNQANTLLSAMALADLGFLFCMLPHSLVSFSVFYRSVRFSSLYFATKTYAVGLANMFSMAATFLVLAVSLERFSGVRRPMHTRFQLRDMRLIGLILAVFAVSFALTFYNHVEYNVNISIGCSNVWATFRHISQVASSSKTFVNYVRHAKYIHSIFGVALPVIIVAILNVSLIYILRRREILPRPVADKKQHNEFRYSDLGALQRQERKVTATVIAIITCFTVTHLPTLIPYIWEKVYTYRDVVTLLNMLLVSGKVLNFVLFCSSSAHFRRRTVTILGAYLCHRRYRKKYSSMIVSGTTPAGITITLPHGNVLLNGHGAAAAASAAATSVTTKTATVDEYSGARGNWREGGSMAPDAFSCASMSHRQISKSAVNDCEIPRRATTPLQRNLTDGGYNNVIASSNDNVIMKGRQVPPLVKGFSAPKIQHQPQKQRVSNNNDCHNNSTGNADTPLLP